MNCIQQTDGLSVVAKSQLVSNHNRPSTIGVLEKQSLELDGAFFSPSLFLSEFQERSKERAREWISGDKREISRKQVPIIIIIITAKAETFTETIQQSSKIKRLKLTGEIKRQQKTKQSNKVFILIGAQQLTFDVGLFVF